MVNLSININSYFQTWLIATQCAAQLWDLPTCNVSFDIGLIYNSLNYKTNVGCCLWVNVLFSTMGYWCWSKVDLFKSIQSWDIDVESMLGSGHWFNFRILTLIQHQNVDRCYINVRPMSKTTLDQGYIVMSNRQIDDVFQLWFNQ